MKPVLVFAGTVCALLTLTGSSRAAAPTLHERSLPNGVRVCYLHVEGSADFSTFAFLPLGLAFDDAGRAQWAHLIEHLVLRTTTPGDLTHANAETLPDHMRLDFYGTKNDWREGLRHHAKWLGGTPFTEKSAREEPARANAETAFAIKALSTHKFATAAWNQAARHGRRHAGVKADLLIADRATLEAYRDARLVAPGRTLVCMVGGVEPEDVLAAAGETLGAIRAAAKPVKGVAIKPGHHHATWDLDARHVLLTWPIPGPAENEKAHAALAVLARLAWVRVAQDAELQKWIGPPIAGADLRCPESSYFYVSATCRPGADAAAARKRLADHVAQVILKPDAMAPVAELARALAAELEPIDPAALRAQAPPNVKPGMIEAQVAITWATADYRLEGRRSDVVKAMKSLTSEQLRSAGGKYLSAERCTSVELKPAS